MIFRRSRSAAGNKEVAGATRLTTSMLSQAWPDESPAPHSEESNRRRTRIERNGGPGAGQILKRPEIVIEKLRRFSVLDPGFFAREEEGRSP